MMTRRGRPSSWVAAVTFLVGFALGGLALILDAIWLILVACGVIALSVVLAIAFDIMSDVVLDPIHGEHAEPHVSPLRGNVSSRAPRALRPGMFGQAPSVGDEESHT